MSEMGHSADESRDASHSSAESDTVGVLMTLDWELDDWDAGWTVRGPLRDGRLELDLEPAHGTVGVTLDPAVAERLASELLAVAAECRK